MRHTSKILVAAALAAMAAPAAFADDFNYLGRGDTVTLATGNANRANLAIQHPTPWPRYVNDVFIEGNGPRSVITITDYYNKSDGSKAAGPSTVINVNGGPAQ